jgi:hypothetical protein
LEAAFVWEDRLLPFILGIGAAVASTLSVGEAALIGASVGAATALGVKALKPKPTEDDTEDETADQQ